MYSSMRETGCCFLQLLLLLLLSLTSACSVEARPSPLRSQNIDGDDLTTWPPVQLHRMDQHVVVMDNGLVNVTLSVPLGMVLGIQYGGIDNLLEPTRKRNLGPRVSTYWDVVWDYPDSSKSSQNIYDRLEGTSFRVVMEDENQVEVSFLKTWDLSLYNNSTRLIPLNVDKRFIMLRGCSGFYSYAIFERLQGWPDFNMYQGRIVFKLDETRFQYMAISDERQRMMPTTQDRDMGQQLDYKEAVLLTNPSNPEFEGEVDDKYQYSSENKDNRVHGWICSDPEVGFWIITPSNEFRSGGPLKQDLTSHVGPTVLSMFFSTHYAGDALTVKFRDGEPWKKVFGPVFIYLNAVSSDENSLSLWANAKEQMLIESELWPYDFPLSEEYYPSSNNRGLVSGRLLVRDRYIDESLMTARKAYVGLASPGDVGSWQKENKGYQFWTQADSEGYFLINGIRPGNYCLYASVPGFVGDYKYDDYLNIASGDLMRLGELIYDPPRRGPTLWEIGIPDRSAAEFFVPDPNPKLLNYLYINDLPNKFRQYGLWERYTDLYPNNDLVFTIGVNSYETDWFFAQVSRNLENNTRVPTIWQINFDIEKVDMMGNYTLMLALASAHEAELQVRINESDEYFTTRLIGKDNAIARHGIHGIYWLFIVSISPSSYELVSGRNIMYLKQCRGSGPFRGVMYDYIRFEGPPSADSN